MMAAPYSGPRNRLRTATHAAHARVDACFPQGLSSTVDYRQYLLGMHALVHSVERAFIGLPLAAPWASWRKPERVQWLLEDMVAVGAMPMHDGPGLRIDSAAEAAGALYVVEGSALGATQLLKDVAAMGLSERHGARFLHRHGGDAAGTRWREYVRCLEGSAFGVDEERSMFEAAARTFAYAEHEFLRAARRSQGDE